MKLTAEQKRARRQARVADLKIRLERKRNDPESIVRTLMHANDGDRGAALLLARKEAVWYSRHGDAVAGAAYEEAARQLTE